MSVQREREFSSADSDSVLEPGIQAVDVLIVDDEVALLDSLTRALDSRLPQLTFAAAEDYDQAERLIAEHPPRLVICDVRLPGRSGVELFLSAQERWPQVRFILMSGYSMSASDLGVNGDRAYEFIEKPFKIDDLALRIEKALPREEFSGQIFGISLTDLLQLMSFGRNSATVELSHLGQSGQIFFSNGEVFHAEVGDLEGIAAFNRLVSWRDGSFKVVRSLLTPTRTIDGSFTGLMMTAMQEFDEARRQIGEECEDAGLEQLADTSAGPPASPFEPSARSVAKTDAEQARDSRVAFDHVLREILEAVPGGIAATVIDLEEGRILANQGSTVPSEPLLEFMLAALRQVYDPAASAAGHGALIQNLSFSTSYLHHFFTRIEQQQVVLCLVVRKPVIVGTGFAALRAALPGVGALIGERSGEPGRQSARYETMPTP